MPRKRTKSPVAGLKAVTSKGRLYWYHRGTGKRLRNEPSSAAGLLEISALDAKAEERPAENDSGSLAAIIVAYRSSDAGRAGRIRPFRSLGKRTQDDYSECLDYLWPVAGKLRPEEMRPRQVQKLVDDAAEASGWVFGDKLLSVLRLIINWGAYHELTAFEAHPCTGVLAPSRAEGLEASNRPWTDAERIAVFSAAPVELLIVFGLCLYAQLNIAHAIDVPPSAIKRTVNERGEVRRRLQWRRAKNAHPIDVGVEGPLETIVDACASEGPRLALNSRGEPWTRSGVNSARKRLLGRLVAAGKVGPGLTFHGLRSTLGAIAAEGGASEKQIAAAIHDGTSEMGALYSRGAESRVLAEAARKPLIERDTALLGGLLSRRLAPTTGAVNVVRMARRS